MLKHNFRKAWLTKTGRDASVADIAPELSHVVMLSSSMRRSFVLFECKAAARLLVLDFASHATAGHQVAETPRAEHRAMILAFVDEPNFKHTSRLLEPNGKDCRISTPRLQT